MYLPWSAAFTRTNVRRRENSQSLCAPMDLVEGAGQRLATQETRQKQLFSLWNFVSFVNDGKDGISSSRQRNKRTRETGKTDNPSWKLKGNN